MIMEQDYLDFDELITFLDQKGYKWNARRTIDLLLEAITDSKLTPVFFYRGEIIATYAKFVGENKWEEVKKDTCRLQGYFSANAYDLVDLYQDYFTCVPNCLTLNGQHVRPYKIFGNPAPLATDHQKRTEGIDTCFLHLSCGSFVDGYRHTVSEFLYPVEQLDSMFDRSNRGQLAIQLDEAINQTTTDDSFDNKTVNGTTPTQQAIQNSTQNNMTKDWEETNQPSEQLIHVKTHTKLGKYQKELINYDVFTPSQIACLILDYPPESSSTNSDFISCFFNIDNAINAGELTTFGLENHIAVHQVKGWLARNNYIYKGFNDNIPADPIALTKYLTNELQSAQIKIGGLNTEVEHGELYKRLDKEHSNDKQLAEAQATIKQITNDYEKALARIEAKDQSADSFMMGSPTVAYDEPETIEQFREALAAANAKIVDLDSQLTQDIATLGDNPANSVPHSNTDMQNVKKVAIKQFNRSLATALIDLDYKGSLRKGDIVSFIIPYMEKLAFVLADENVDKAKLLVVKSETIYKTHLQGLKFKQGTQKNKDRERENIDLLFKKQLSVTE